MNDTNANIDRFFSIEAANEAVKHWTRDMADFAEQEMLHIELELDRATTAAEIEMLQMAYRWLDTRHHAFMVRISRGEA